MPKLSIITINLNNLQGLQKTMESVFAQTFTDYEYIIIDGGSTDGSKEYIEQHAEKMAYWVSENDGGIFNAMNKGIRKCKGEYLLFLNSGDYLLDSTVTSDVFNHALKSDIIYGNVIWKPILYNGNYPSILTFEHFLNNTIPHQGSFIKKGLFNLVGRYEEEYSVNSDWNFFVLAIFKFNCSYKHIDKIISVCDTDGISLTEAGKSETARIRETFFEKHFSNYLVGYNDSIRERKELSYFNTLMQQRIMKSAFHVNRMYQRFRKSLKRK